MSSIKDLKGNAILSRRHNSVIIVNIIYPSATRKGISLVNFNGIRKAKTTFARIDVLTMIFKFFQLQFAYENKSKQIKKALREV